MTKEEQVKLIEALCDSIKDHMTKAVVVDKIPEHWDGFELRHLLFKIAKFEDILSDKIRSKPYKRRKKDCENTIIVNNLT